jgi:hypothetical protein
LCCFFTVDKKYTFARLRTTACVGAFIGNRFLIAMKKKIITAAITFVFLMNTLPAVSMAYGGGLPPIPPVPVFPNEKVEKIITDLQKRFEMFSKRTNKRLDEVRERLSHLPRW